MVPDKVKEIVELNRQAVLTTFRESGAAQMSIVTVGVYREGVAFTISPGTAKMANLRRNPRCAVLEGRARVMSPGTTPAEELRADPA